MAYVIPENRLERGVCIVSAKPSATMTIATELASTREDLLWIDNSLADVSIRSTDGSVLPRRVTGAACCFHQTMEHALAIERLFSDPPHYGSAFALLRSLFESLVRGLWLLHSATNRQAENFVDKDKLKFNLDELIERVERHHPALSGGTLSRIKAGAWDAFCGFAHTGANQIARRIRPGQIVANYSEGECIEVILATRFFALLAAFEIAVLSNSEVWRQILEKLQAIASAPTPAQLP